MKLQKQVYTYVLTNSVAQEPEGSSPHSQQPATGPYPVPVESNPHPQACTYVRCTSTIITIKEL
jgi:hypothetical protein